MVSFGKKYETLISHTSIDVNSSANNLTDCVTSLASVLSTVYIVHVRTRAEAEKNQTTVLMDHSDFRYGHYPRAVL